MYASSTIAGVQSSANARATIGITGVQNKVHARGTACPGLGIGSKCHWRTNVLAASAIAVSAGVQFSMYARGTLPRNILIWRCFLLAGSMSRTPAIMLFPMADRSFVRQRYPVQLLVSGYLQVPPLLHLQSCSSH